MKRNHENKVERKMRSDIGEVKYETLERLLTSLAIDASPIGGDIELSIPIKNKIKLNCLSESTERIIQEGLAQIPKVQHVMTDLVGANSNYERRITAAFKMFYEMAVAEGMSSDDAFHFVCAKIGENGGGQMTSENEAAALSLVAYMFELCEIFEHD